MKYSEKIYNLFIEYCKKEKTITIYDDYRDHENIEYLLLNHDKSIATREDFICNIMDAYSDSESYYIDDFIKDFVSSLSQKLKDYFYNHENDLLYDLHDILYDYIDIEYPINAFLNDEIKINIFYKTKIDSGYDDGWLPKLLHTQQYKCKNHQYLKKMLNCLHVYHNQRITEKDKKQYKEDSNNSIFLKSLINEIESCYLDSPRELCFIASVKIDDYFKLLEKNKIFTIKKDAVCGLVDYYNGGGSVLDIQLEKDIKLNTNNIKILIEKIDKYTVDDIYGLCGSCFKDCIEVK